MRFKSYIKPHCDREMIYVYDLDNFDPTVISNSGQCFRTIDMPVTDAERVWFIHRDKVCVVEKISDTEFIFDCSVKDFIYVWYDYFDFGTDYSRFNDVIVNSGDDYLINAMNASYGMRILRQDLFEVIVSFIISQQMQIPRIKKIIHEICWRYGEKFQSAHPSFPEPYTFSLFDENDYKLFGLGYRGPYLQSLGEAICKGDFNLSKLYKMDYEDALKNLISLNGVGGKVGNCVCLYGLHHLEAFPIDTWIQQILNQHYNGDSSLFLNPDSIYEGFQGYVQQLMFYYERSIVNGK